MDYPDRNLPRQCLVPVVPEPAVYSYHWQQAFDPAMDGRIHYLNKHADRLADFCVVAEPDPQLIERIERETGKLVVPTITTATEIRDAEGNFLERYQDPSGFQPTGAHAAWVDYVTAHVDRWPWVMLVTSAYFDTISSDFVLYPVLEKLLARFPQFRGKMGFGLWHEAIDYEASLYRGHLEDSPMLNFLLAQNALVMVYMGLDVLWPDLGSMVAAGYTTGNIWHHVVKHDPPLDFPFRHLQDFHHRLNCRLSWAPVAAAPYGQSAYYARQQPFPASFSGIGFSQGGRNHHLAKLVEFGYSGCCFFLPGDISEESDRMMYEYLTDIE